VEILKYNRALIIEVPVSGLYKAAFKAVLIFARGYQNAIWFA